MRMNIHKAAETGDTQRVKDLLDRPRRKVSLDARDKSGFTPLHRAARNGHTEIVALLLERGADVNARSEYGMTPLHLGGTETVVLLLDHGADVHARDERGVTPLESAAMGGDVETASLLLDRGADVNARSNDGAIARRRAVPLDSPEVWIPGVLAPACQIRTGSSEVDEWSPGAASIGPAPGLRVAQWPCDCDCQSPQRYPLRPGTSPGLPGSGDLSTRCWWSQRPTCTPVGVLFTPGRNNTIPLRGIPLETAELSSVRRKTTAHLLNLTPAQKQRRYVWSPGSPITPCMCASTSSLTRLRS